MSLPGQLLQNIVFNKTLNPLNCHICPNTSWENTLSTVLGPLVVEPDMQCNWLHSSHLFMNVHFSEDSNQYEGGYKVSVALFNATVEKIHICGGTKQLTVWF